MSIVSGDPLSLVTALCCVSSEAQVRAGALVHYVTVGKREKGLPAHTEVHGSAVEGSQRCELEVLSVHCVQLAPCATGLGWPSSAFESLILLKTGRTHQVTKFCSSMWH